MNRIDKSFIALVFVMLLMAPALLGSPNLLIDSSDESLLYPEGGVTLAADGAESTESITSFSETLTDDTSLDPDSDTNGDFSKEEWNTAESITDDTWLMPDTDDNFTAATEAVLDGRIQFSYLARPEGAEISTIGGANWQDDADGGEYVVIESNSVEWCYVNMTFRVPTAWSFIPVRFDIRYWEWQDPDGNITIFNPTTLNQDVLSADEHPCGAWGWRNRTISTSTDYSFVGSGEEGQYVRYRLQLFAERSGVPNEVVIAIDYFRLQFAYNESGVYSEAFTDVSDWTENGLEANDSASTDGDVWSLHSCLTGTSDSDEIITDAPSLSDTVGYYLEFRAYQNTTDIYTGRVYIFTEDGQSGSNQFAYWSGVAGSFQTVRIYVTISAVESIRIMSWLKTATPGPVLFKIDYLRIGPATKMGWEHDGSTTEVVTNDAVADTTYTMSTDGDILTLNLTRAEGVGASYSEFWIYYDTTTTAIDLELDYYPFFEARVKCTGDAGTVGIQTNIDSLWSRKQGGYTGDWETIRWNMAEGTTISGAKIRFYAYLLAGYSQQLEIDYMKVYAMVNWSYNSQGTNDRTSGVAYLDDAEDAIVLQKNFDGANDYLNLNTRNTSIGYDIEDMVMMFTIKASANTSAITATRVYRAGGGYETATYYLCDVYQTFALPLTDMSDNAFTYILLNLGDWSDAAPSGSVSIYIKNNITLRPSWYDATGESDTYAESFADVSDWTMWSPATISTDGDVGSIMIASDDDWNQGYSDTPSCTPSGSYYLEIRHKANISGFNQMIFRTYSGDGASGLLQSITLTAPTTSWATTKHLITNATKIESVAFTGDDNANTEYMVDYIRIGPATEMGSQIDMSSIQGELVGHANWDTTLDTYYHGSDTIAFECDWGGGTDYDRWYWNGLQLEYDYYQFVEVRYRFSSTSGWYDSWIRVYPADSMGGGSGASVVLTKTTSWTTTRMNLLEDIECFEMWVTVTSADVSLYIDYIKFYSIANWTVTTANNEASDFIYVDSTDLYESGYGSPNEYVLLDYDITLSVNAATYNVCNITTNGAGGSTLNGFYTAWYVSSWNTEYKTRYDLTGVTTDFKILIGHGGTVGETGLIFSAITFIEDGTAPTISNFWTVPYTPTEEDAVTLAIYATDICDVFEVTFNAIDSPGGFSDVDYEATENDEQEGLFQYSFADGDLPAGYYAFEATVSDAANTVTGLECFRVTTVVLAITNIILITATPLLAQMSGHSNKDASYTIYENNTDSGSGSVSSGWFSFSWTKDATAGIYIELGIKFTAGIYTDWVNGSYSVASAEVLYVTDAVYSASDSYNYLSGYLNLGSVTWTAYDNDTQKATGSLGAGSFSILWAKVFARGLHEWGVKFTDGTTTRWVNGSYEADGLVITDLLVMQNNETVIVSGYFYTSNLTLTWIAYEAGVQIDSGSFTLTTNGEYYSIYWEKNEPTTFNNFTLSITADGSTINLHSYSLVLDTATYLTSIGGTAYTVFEGDTYLEGDTIEGVPSEDVVGIILSATAFGFVMLFIGGIGMWWDNRKKKERDFRAAVGS